MSLETGIKLSRSHWTELPVTVEVINTVDNLEEKDKG